MHGHFYHQQYIQGQGSSSARNNDPTALHYAAQRAAALTNGQSYQGHGGQHLQQQFSQVPQSSDFSPHPYRLLQNPALYSHAAVLQHQQQSPSATRQQQDQQRILQQQFDQSDQTIRSLLSSTSALQHYQLSQFHARSLSPHLLGVQASDLMSRQSTKTGTRYADEAMRDHTDRHEQDSGVQRSHSQTGLQNRNLPQNQNLMSPDILSHLSTTPSQSPTSFYRMPDFMRSPPANPSGIVSPNHAVYSPMRSHGAGVTPNRQHSTHPTRTSMGPVQEQQYGTYPGVVNRSMSQELQSPQKTAPNAGSSGVTQTNVHVKRQTPSVNSSTAPVIVVDSDSDGETFVTQQRFESPKKPTEAKVEVKTNFKRVVIDDDIEITGFKEAEVMSHMRPDCPIHNFERVDQIVGSPHKQNALKCSKCYCYVCDKLATECDQWEKLDPPHCNAHPKASCWKARRNVKKSPLMQKIPNDQITAEMKEAGKISLQYMIRIREQYITYRNGIPCEYLRVPCDCPCHRSHPRSARDEPCMNCKIIHDAKKKFNYEPVREAAFTIIEEIQKKYHEHPVLSLIALEAVLSELCSQRPADFNHTTRRQSNPDLRCQCNFPAIIEEYIEKEFISLLTRFEVPAFFLDALIKSVEEAIKPLQLEKIMKKFLAMKHWNDLLLRAVMTGSNVSGSKGRDQLRESTEIVRHRAEKLLREKKYLQLLRYLKALRVLQTSKDESIFIEIERWKMLCAAHVARFKEVIIHVIDTLSGKILRNGITHEILPVHFMIQLLDVLTNKDVTRTFRMDSFESISPVNYKIAKHDADAVALLVVWFIHQKHLPSPDKLRLTLWLAKWVNREAIITNLNPSNTRVWVHEGEQIMRTADQSMAIGNCQNILLMLEDRDPRVHIFLASMCVMRILRECPRIIQAEQRKDILHCYQNNQWALFLLVTQMPMMNFHDSDILRWVTKFCKENHDVITQIQDTVVLEAIKFYPLDVVSDFLAALIKPEWPTSIEPIKRTVILSLAEYSARLFSEMPQTLKDVLKPKAKWVEEIIIKPFLEQKFSVPHDLHQTFKNIIKASCFLSPVKRNVDISRRILGDEWPRHCEKLTMLLMGKLRKFGQNSSPTTHGCPDSGSMEELSLLFWLLWISNRVSEFVPYFSYFQENHSCDTNENVVSSSKIPDEIGNLLESTIDENFSQMKLNLMESCRRLCVVETLSWLTCTGCASRMPTHWTRIWVSTAKCRLPNALNALITAMLTQFKEWLNKISLDNAESYDRLLKCLRTFLCNLVTTWQHCAVPLEEAKKLLLDVASVVADSRFSKDLAELGSSIVEAEWKKLHPELMRAPVEPVQQLPPAVVRQTQPSPPGPKKVEPPQLSKPARKPSAEKPQNQWDRKSKLEELPRKQTLIQDLPRKQTPMQELPRKQTPIPSSLPTLKHNGPTKEPETTKPQIAKTPVSSKTSECGPRSTLADEGEPFSPLNLSRTKPCPNCHLMISCANFRCPHCNRPTRSKQPVICPGCHQENLEVKKYTCEFCYRSLIDVIFAAQDLKAFDPKPQKDKDPQKVKKKSEKRRKKHKAVGSQSTVTTVTSEETTQQPSPKVLPKTRPPLKPMAPMKISTMENSESSSDDFVTEPPRKQPKYPLTANLSKKVKPAMSRPVPVPPKISPRSSLTDSDSDSSNESPNPISSPVCNRPFEATLLLPNKAPTSPVKKPSSFEKERALQRSHSNSNVKANLSNKPRASSKPDEALLNPPNKTPAQPQTPSGPKKRGVGHSSAMSKMQKKVLQNIKKIGKGGPKFTPTPKPHLPNKTKDTPKFPKSIPTTSPGHHLNEKFHNDSSFHSNSQTGLSFSLAKVRPRNVGHRTGGPPGLVRKTVSAKEPVKDTLLPRALNDNCALGKPNRSANFVELTKRPRVGVIRRLEKKINSMTSKRRAGPASRSNYRKLVKAERKLRKLRRPNKLWKIPPKIILPPDSDLSVYMRVSLSPFPADKLKRIQSLLPRYRLHALYA